jgi:hypothetical protein
MNKKQESYDIWKQEGSKWKKMQKKFILQFEKTYFLYSSLLAGPSALHLKDDL